MFSTSRLKTILLVLGLFVLYPNENLRHRATQARTINDLSVPGLDSKESSFPVTIKVETQRYRFLVEDKIREDLVQQGNAASVKHEKEIKTKGSPKDETNNINKWAKLTYLDTDPHIQSYDKKFSTNPRGDDRKEIGVDGSKIHPPTFKVVEASQPVKHQALQITSFEEPTLASTLRNTVNSGTMNVDPINTNSSSPKNYVGLKNTYLGLKFSDENDNERPKELFVQKNLEKESTIYKSNVYSRKTQLEDKSSVGGNSNDTYKKEDTTEEMVFEIDKEKAEVNTDPPKLVLNNLYRSDVNFPREMQDTSKIIDGKNRNRRKEQGSYSKKEPHPGIRKIMGQKEGEWIRNRDPGRYDSSYGNFPKSGENFEEVISPSNLYKTLKVTKQADQSYLEVRASPHQETDIGSVIYVGENQKRLIRESCDSIGCKILDLKVIIITSIAVFATIGLLVILICVNKKQKRGKYKPVEQGELLEDRKPSCSSKHKKESIVSTAKQQSRQSKPVIVKRRSSTFKKKYARNISDKIATLANDYLGYDIQGTSKKVKDERKSSVSLNEERKGSKHSNGRSKLSIKEPEIKRKERHKTRKNTTDSSQELIEMLPGEVYIELQPKAQQENSVEQLDKVEDYEKKVLKAPLDKTVARRVTQWLQKAVSGIQLYDSAPKVVQSKESEYVHPNENRRYSKKRGSRSHPKRRKSEVERFVEELDQDSEEMAIPPSPQDLKKRMMTSGQFEAVDQMLVGENWGKSLLTGHGFQTIGREKVSNLRATDCDDRMFIDMKKIARYGKSNEMGSNSSGSTALTNAVKEGMRCAKVNKSFPNSVSSRKRNRHQ